MQADLQQQTQMQHAFIKLAKSVMQSCVLMLAVLACRPAFRSCDESDR